MQQPGSYYVWTISKENTASITPVVLGSILGNKQHVISGLKEGDAVIVKGMKRLRSGEAIAVTNGTATK
jgi:multidrug efflux pump subunit AcrA (membrane-fusion protein)